MASLFLLRFFLKPLLTLIGKIRQQGAVSPDIHLKRLELLWEQQSLLTMRQVLEEELKLISDLGTKYKSHSSQ